MAEPVLSIRLLGSFQVAWGGQPITGMDQARLQELLAYLVLHRGRPVPRRSIAFLFWPDSTDKQALTNGRHLWHRLRKALPEAGRWLAADDLAVLWRDDPRCEVDVIAFGEALARANHATEPGEQAEQLRRATACYGGELLPGCYSDWLLVERERLARENARALQQLLAYHENRRQYPEAIGFTRALLRHDPLNEPAYTDLMRLCALNGDRAAALHAYHTFATVLRRELDVAPGQAARELYERLLNQESSPAAWPGGTAVPLVGRDKPWADLQQVWRRATGRPQLALVSGEAGIGKSRLAEELAEWIARQGIAALVARCYATGSELAYAPVVTWLRSRPLPPLADSWRRELARLMPETLAQHPHLPPPGPLTEKWQRLHLFEALAHALLDHRSALLLFVDDLQWCDGDTLDWLTYLLTDQRIQANRPQLLVVAAVRSGEEQAGAKLDAWRAGLAHSGQLTEVALGSLSEQSTRALAGQVAEQPVSPQLAAALYRDTEGHPLFIIETVRAGLGQGAAAGGPEPAAAMLPGRVRQVLATRLAQLSPGARGVIEAAAVIGRAFTYDVLHQATGLAEDELVNHLDEAWRRRLIREQGEADYDFSHDKLRQVAYDGLSRARRRHLHGRIATALEAGHADDLERVAGAIAGHYEAAGLPEKAVAWLERAAAAAARVYAHQEGLALVGRALGLLTFPPRGATGPAWAARLHEQGGDLHRRLAQHEAARGAYGLALGHTLPEDRVGQARLHRKIGKTVESGNGKFEAVSACYKEAERALGLPADADDPAIWQEWCQIQMEHVLLLYWWQRAEEMASRISAIYPYVARHGTPEQRATLLGHLSRQANTQNRFGPSSAALDNARAALAALPAEASPEQRMVYQFSYGFNLLWNGEYDRAGAELRAALAAAELTGDVALQARCLAYLLLIARRRGLDGQVAMLAEQCLAVAETSRMANYAGAALAGMAWVAWRAGSTAEAGRLARSALESWERFEQSYPLKWQAFWPLLGLALAGQRMGEAMEQASALLQPDQQVLPDALTGPLAAGLAAWEAGQAATASGYLAQALAAAQQMNYD
jgi:DNA-binding SARP family transcriptional activator